MTEVDVIDDEFILAFDPPREVFKEFVQLVSTTEGWAFQENDYEIWKSCYPKHWMFMVQQRGTDKYVASVSLAKSELRDGSPLFSVAFFYCVSEFRNRGFGKILFEKIHSIYGDHNCFLFGVGTMWKWYERKFGFDRMNHFFHNSASIRCEELKLPELENLVEIRTEDVDVEKVNEFDEVVCKMRRGKVIENWLTSSAVHSKMALDSNLKCVGYGAVREVSLNRLSISPLYADSPQIAALILRSILSSFDFSKFRTISAIYPSTNFLVPELLNSFCERKLSTQQFCRGQFTQKILNTEVKKVFAIRHCAHGYV